jgi:hypothetical protein
VSPLIVNFSIERERSEFLKDPNIQDGLTGYGLKDAAKEEPPPKVSDAIILPRELLIIL